MLPTVLRMTGTSDADGAVGAGALGGFVDDFLASMDGWPAVDARRTADDRDRADAPAGTERARDHSG